MFSLKYYRVNEGKQKVNFHKKTTDNHDQIPEHISIFCLKV